MHFVSLTAIGALSKKGFKMKSSDWLSACVGCLVACVVSIALHEWGLFGPIASLVLIALCCFSAILTFVFSRTEYWRERQWAETLKREEIMNHVCDNHKHAFGQFVIQGADYDAGIILRLINAVVHMSHCDSCKEYCLRQLVCNGSPERKKTET